MKNEEKKTSSGIPIVIIVLVLVGVVVAGWYFYSQSKPGTNTNTNRGNANANQAAKGSQIPANAPPGATPPNMLGSPTASVVLEEFADFQCGSCAATHPVMKEIQSTYGSKIKLIFRNYPLQMHDKAYDAAVAAEAAGLQGKFWAMQDQLFNNQQTWASPSANAKDLWASYAEKIGLDVTKWQSDIAGLAAKSRVDQDMQRARVINVSSTPTLFINGQSVPFPEMNAAGLRRIIDAELQKATAQTQPAQNPATQPAAPAANNTNTANAQ
jgi:protein-disulfide isomerase